jgi:hypothetical protein
MRTLAIVAVGVATAVCGVGEAVAQNSGPVIVIPTRRDVPVVLYGRDVSYVVVESDWGLSRPGHLAPAIVGYAPPVGDRASPVRGVNFPRYGRAPARGRNEADPADRPVAEPAEPFSRSWGASSADVPRPTRMPINQRPIDPFYPPVPGPGPQSKNTLPPGAAIGAGGFDSVPATVTDPQTFMMPPVVIDRRP